jgi:hypothetical protein
MPGRTRHPTGIVCSSEASAPGRFYPGRTALVQKRTAAALYAFGDLSQPIRTASAEAQRRRVASL